MTERATFTQAELERALKTADKTGRTVKILFGAMYFVDPEDVPKIPRSHTINENDLMVAQSVAEKTGAVLWIGSNIMWLLKPEDQRPHPDAITYNEHQERLARRAAYDNVIFQPPDRFQPEKIYSEKRRNIPPEVRREVFERDGMKCKYCGTTEGDFHLDHVLPWSRGGTHTADNLVVSCRPCNQNKANKTLEEWGRATIHP